MQVLFEQGLTKKMLQSSPGQAGLLASMNYIMSASILQFLFNFFCTSLLHACSSPNFNLFFSFYFLHAFFNFVDFRRTRDIEGKKEGGLEGDEQDEVFPEEEEKEEEEEKAKEQEINEKGEGQEVTENCDKEEVKESGHDEKAQEDQAEEGKEDDR